MRLALAKAVVSVLATVTLLGACTPAQADSTPRGQKGRSCHCKEKKIRWKINFNINHRRTPIRIHR